MTTKKKAQSRAQLKAQAAATIADVRGYNADTRRAVYVALANLKFAETNPQPSTEYTDAGYCEGKLRRVLEAAEKGEHAFDVNALDANARLEDVNIWLDVDDSGHRDVGGYSVAGIAVLLRRVGVGGVTLEARRDLAGLISGVLNHPDTPRHIYNKLSEAVGEMAVKDDVVHTAEVLRVALAVHKAEGEGGGES